MEQFLDHFHNQTSLPGDLSTGLHMLQHSDNEGETEKEKRKLLCGMHKAYATQLKNIWFHLSVRQVSSLEGRYAKINSFVNIKMFVVWTHDKEKRKKAISYNILSTYCNRMSVTCQKKSCKNSAYCTSMANLYRYIAILNILSNLLLFLGNDCFQDYMWNL